MDVCFRCMLAVGDEQRVLHEICHSRDRSLQDMLRQMQYGDGMSSFREKANRSMEARLRERRKKRAEYEEKLKQREEEISYEILDRLMNGEDIDRAVERILQDEIRKELERQLRQTKYELERLTAQDLRESLKDYIERGEIDLEGENIRITPKGGRKLARYVLGRILEKLAAKEIGAHSLQDTGYGADLSISSRRYEPGDEYHRIDFEGTFLNALERNQTEEGISLETEDFRVYEEIHHTKMCSGLIIDESGSMSGDKISAAIDTSLALSELIRRDPKDSLRVFLFSSEVKEIPYYDILNASFAGGTTDLRGAMRAFRKAVANEKGDKQAYLITDTEPNTEDGRYVGFEEAIAGVIQEAEYYRQAGITLNIIMLDQTPSLKELASILAKKNLGRVFFTSPRKLGETVVEDYLTAKGRTYKVF